MPELRSQKLEVRSQKRKGCDLFLVVWGVLGATLLGSPVWAVTSKVHRQVSGQELSRGDVNDVVIGSRGTIQLGHAARTLIDRLDGAWAIQSLVVSGGSVYVGTGPNGAIYEVSLGQSRKVYPTGREKSDSDSEEETAEDANRVINEHVYAMTVDGAGRLVAGISGSRCRLLRLTGRGPETLCEFNEAKYLFALAVDEAGTLYIGTGPEGKVYKLGAKAKTPELVYDSPDKNVLSLALGKDGWVYAGTDTRGLIYKIHPKDRTGTVLYDCAQPEIAGLVFAEDAFAEGLGLYAIGTSAKVASAERELRVVVQPGRPETVRRGGDTPGGGDKSEDSRVLKVANTKKETPSESPPPRPLPVRRTERADTASRLYRLTPDGYVNEVASESSVFFCLGSMGKSLLIGTGNDARLLRVDPAFEQQTILYQDKQASQITAVASSGGDIYVGAANPARLVRLGAAYAAEGIYTSDLIDADQPARWGKLQIDADVPAGCKVLMASRSGNVEDINDPTFSPWTDPVEVAGPVPLGCPLGRFCQYRLILQSPNGEVTPVIREVTLASTLPNLDPVVDSVDVSRIGGPPSKQGNYKIAFKAHDGNDDKLIYTLSFRKVAYTQWIEVKDTLEEETFEWDGRTVEDGRYEIRVVASDERSNTPSTRRTGSRISDPVVVDNTAPTIRSHRMEKKGKATTVVLEVCDQFSVIGQVEYTVDSHDEWKGAVPEDGVCDTTEETFTIQIEDLSAGEHVLAVKISDDLNNTAYRSFNLSEVGPP